MTRQEKKTIAVKARQLGHSAIHKGMIDNIVTDQARIEELMEERSGLYEAAADITVDTTNLTVDEVVVEIKQGLESIGFGND